MSGICIDKLSHNCGTRKGLQVFADPETGKVDGFCYSCRTFVANPYGKPITADEVELPKQKTPEEIATELAEVSGFPVVDISQRRLRAKYLDEFGVKVAMSEGDGKTPAALYFPIHKGGSVSGYYIKTLSTPSIQSAIGDVKKAPPFGWEQAKRSGAYKLIITEGREDAVAVVSMFDRHGKEEYKPAVIALPNGVNSVTSSLSQIADEASRMFKEIVICFDNDDAGRQASEDAMLIFPKALSATLPEKDANDCLLNGSSKAGYKALAFNASKPKNTRLVVANKDFHIMAREPTPYGELTWPWEGMNSRMRGLRLGETIYIGAGVKMGKSEVVDSIGSHLIQNDGVPILMAKPEQENKNTYKKVCGKVVGRHFTDPDKEFDFDAYDRAGKVIENKLTMVDLYQHLGWDSLQKDIVAAANFGCKAVFIDPITNLTAGMHAADVNTLLTGVARDLSAMAKDLGLVVFIFCHLKAPEGNISFDQRAKHYREGRYHGLGNCPHERGGSVLSSQFAGSRAMMQACNLMLGIEGNKDPELDEEIRNLRWLSILEDREFGNSDGICLHWNKNTTQFKEV
jgi:twinkle protein